MGRPTALFKKATFVMGRGYDDNKMFLKLDSMKQEYIIRLTAKRKLPYHNKGVFVTELRNRLKYPNNNYPYSPVKELHLHDNT